MSKVMVVDDHPMVREGLEAMLEAAGFEVCALASDGTEAISFFKAKVHPDIVLMDIRMPGGSGFDVFKEMKVWYPDIKVLFLAGMPLRVELERAKKEGAHGYLSKSTKRYGLVTAIKRILSERNVFVEDDVPEQPQDSLLTQRNMEVLKWLAQGKSREETAVILGISLETVKTHAKSILQKLEVQNTAGAITRAFELGLLRA
ncbi:MAG: response regulator transcription factor [Kiritimatiellia bacterium]